MLSRWFGKKPAPVEPILEAFMGLLAEDADLLMPRVFLGRIEQAEIERRIGLAPAVYVWNEDWGRKSFSLSVNGKAFGHLLESIIPRTDPRFAAVRDRALAMVSERAKASLVNTCSIMGCMPSDMLPPAFLD